METASVSEEINEATTTLDGLDLEESSSMFTEAASTSEDLKLEESSGTAATSTLRTSLIQEERSSGADAISTSDLITSTLDNQVRSVTEATSTLRTSLIQEERSSGADAISTSDLNTSTLDNQVSSVTEATSTLRTILIQERSSVADVISTSDDQVSSVTEDPEKGSSATEAAAQNWEESSLTPAEWNALPAEVQDLILAFCSFPDLIRHRSVSKSFRDVIHRKNFQQARVRLFRREFHLSPLVFYVQDGLWHILALDYKARIWRKLPPFPDSIPAPDIDLFKDFLVASHGGLFVVNVGKPSEPEKLFVCNPLTGATEELPPLAHSRHPVVLHMRVTLTKTEDVITSSYLVIAVGSSATGTESLSRKTEVYDSVKGKWAEAGDVPGSDFSLNDHQSGVYSERESLLLCVGFMANGMKGILAFDVGKREWLADWNCPLFVAEGNNLSVHFAIAQLVECSGVIYLFSEQESGRNVTHCIDRLDIVSANPGHVWTRVVTRQRQGYRALLVYPEYTCLPVGENKLCIFNTIERTGVVYDMSEESVDPERFEELPACTPMDDGVVFHSLNPVAYAFEPSFGVSVS